MKTIKEWLSQQKDDWNSLTGGGWRSPFVFVGQLVLAALGVIIMAFILVIGGIVAGPKGNAGLLDFFR